MLYLVWIVGLLGVCAFCALFSLDCGITGRLRFLLSSLLLI